MYIKSGNFKPGGSNNFMEFIINPQMMYSKFPFAINF